MNDIYVISKISRLRMALLAIAISPIWYFMLKDPIKYLSKEEFLNNSIYGSSRYIIFVFFSIYVIYYAVLCLIFINRMIYVKDNILYIFWKKITNINDILDMDNIVYPISILVKLKDGQVSIYTFMSNNSNSNIIDSINNLRQLNCGNGSAMSRERNVN